MNTIIASIFMWSLLVQFEGGIVTAMKEAKSFFEPVTVHALCIPQGHMEVSSLERKAIINFCKERVILCSERDRQAVVSIPEVAQWIAVYTKLVTALHNKPGVIASQGNSAHAIKMLEKVAKIRELVRRMGVDVVGEFYEPTPKDMQRWTALCKAHKDQQKAIVIHNKKHGLYKSVKFKGNTSLSKK